jgi:outer membrane protein
MRNVRFLVHPALVLVFAQILFSPFFASSAFGNTTLRSLRECVQQAIENEPEARKLKGQIDLGDTKTTEAFLQFFPTVTLSTTYAPQLNYFGDILTDKNVYATGVSVEQPLYRGGSITSTYELTKSETMQYVFQYQAKAQEVAQAVAKEFYNTLAAKENLRLYEQLHVESEALLSIARKSFDMGLATRVDLLEAEKNFYDTKSKKLKSEQGYRIALLSLKKAMGIDPLEEMEPWEESPILPIQEDVERLVAEASNRHDILYNEETVAFSNLKVKLNKSRELPSISLYGAYDIQGPDFPGYQKYWNVGVKFSISLFNSTLGLSTQRNQLYKNEYALIRDNATYDLRSATLALNDGSTSASRVQEAWVEKKYAEEKLSQSRRDVVLEVKEAFYRVQQTESLMESYKKAVEAAKEKFRVIRYRHELREATYKDLIEAQGDLTEAEVNYACGVFERSVALANLYKATGRNLRWE